MSLWECRADGVWYFVGAPRCPECGTNNPVEVGDVPKINTAGVSNQHLTEPETAVQGDREIVVVPTAPVADPVDTEQREPEETGDEVEAPDYESWTNAKLKAELGERELSTKGNHDELVLRLMESDEQRAAEADEQKAAAEDEKPPVAPVFTAPQAD